MTSLHQLTVNEGFVANAGGIHVLHVGVDARCAGLIPASPLVADQCHSGWIFHATYRHGPTKSPELVTLFIWCACLLQLPVAPLFVFDGAHRPKNKQGKQVRGNEHWVTRSMKQMLDGFGLHGSR
jgi:Holliday junction resolvase YEN1